TSISTTADWTVAGNWSAPVAVTGTGLPSSMIDPYVTKRGSTYYLWHKGVTYTEIASSASLLTGYTPLRTGDWAGWNAWAGGNQLEGVMLCPAPSGADRAILSKYTGTNPDLYYSDQTAGDWTGGGATTWSAPVRITDRDGTANSLFHGSMVQRV